MVRAPSTSILVLTVLACLLSPRPHVLGQTSASAPGHLELKASDPAAFEFLISGVKNERRKLLSGVARFRGTYVEKHKENSSLELDGPTDGLVAIDGGKVRFDMSGPGWAVDHKSVERIPNSAMVKGRTVRGRCTTRFADDRLRVTLWHSNNSMAVIALPRDLPDRSAYQYVDIRGITLLSPGAIAKQLTLEKACDALAAHRKDEGNVKQIDDSTWLLTFSARVKPEQLVRVSLTVDVKSGFTPTDYKCEHVPVGKENELGWSLDFENRTRWTQINQVWVPSHHEFQLWEPEKGSGSLKTFDFQWESVNAPVDPSLFTYKTFELPDSVWIQDVSGGQPAMIKGMTSVAEGGTHPQEGGGTRWFSVVLLGCGGLVIIVVSILLLARRRRRRSGTVAFGEGPTRS